MIKNAILDKAKAHFKAQVLGEMKSLYVEEWETTIYWRPLNALQRDRIMKFALQNEMTSAAVEQVVLRSLTEDGKRIFNDADKADLMRNVDPKVIDRIFGEMGGLDDDIMPEINDVKES